MYNYFTIGDTYTIMTKTVSTTNTRTVPYGVMQRTVSAKHYPLCT